MTTLPDGAPPHTAPPDAAASTEAVAPLDATASPAGPTSAAPATQTGHAETPVTVWRARLAAVCVLLVALCLRQSPGRTVPDTKLDLTVDPGGFLTRALSMWEPSAFGQLQNQAYGYLFPMGPFHWALISAGVPAWVTQRLWWGFVLSVALVGFWRLATALGIGSPWARFLAAILFALSPRFLSEIAITSVEVWPMAMAAWVLVPLVDPRERSWRMRIAVSALAFAAIGGVNAVATGAALVLPTLWWLTRRPSWVSTLRAAGWLGACLLGALWWIGPLVLLGAYSPPFLSWIEDAQVTTRTASAFAAMQGTTHWLTWLRLSDGPSWPTGWLLVTNPVLIVTSCLVAVLGLVGLTRRGLPEATWLRLSVVVGLTLLTLGFMGPAAAPWAQQVRDLLDGPLAATRNIHKFELVLRLPLLLAACYLFAEAPGWRPLRSLARPVTTTVVVTLTLAAAAPAIAGQLSRPGSYDQLPAYWRDAASWLDAQAAPGSVLVVPAAPFADFTWGSTKDEPLQALMRRPFAVRDAVPLGTAGTTRFLDEVQRRLATGDGAPELKRALNDAGIRYVVVRNDLALTTRTASTVQVHEALAESGLTRAAEFGPLSGSPIESSVFTVDERTLLNYRSVEIYDTGRTSGARLVGLPGVVAADAGPEDIVALDRSLPAGAVTVMGSDRDALGDEADELPEVVTDGLQRREVAFGSSADNTSPVLAAVENGRTGRKVIDYVADAKAQQTVRQWEGVADVTASSSASDATAVMRLGTGSAVAAALDGDPTTRWVSGNYLSALGEWFEVRFERPTALSGTTIRLSTTSPIQAAPTRLRITTDRGSVVQTVSDPLASFALQVPNEAASWVRITLDGVAAGTENGFGIVDLAIPAVTPIPRLVMPTTTAPAPAAVAIRAQNVGRGGCAIVDERPLCSHGSVKPAEEAAGLFRRFTTRADHPYVWSGTVMPADWAAVTKIIDQPGATSATATSSAVDSVAGRPGAVVDRDLGTGWVAGPYDATPQLTLRLPSRRAVTGLQLINDQYLAASRAVSVEVTTGDGPPRTLTPDAQGYLRFTATTSTITLRVLSTTGVRTMDSVTGYITRLPVGMSEIRILGADDTRKAIPLSTPVAMTCGFGPTLTIDGTGHPTAVRGTYRQLVRGQPLRWTACTPGPGAGTDTTGLMTIGAGNHNVTARSTAEFRPTTLDLTIVGGGIQVRPDTRPVTVASGGEASGAGGGTRYAVPARTTTSLLVLPHNTNRGWVAKDATGRELTPIRVNGWQQGYVVPAGAATEVTTDFAPGHSYRTLLVAGGVIDLLLALLVLGGAFRTRRRARSSLTHSAAKPAATTHPARPGSDFATGHGSALPVDDLAQALDDPTPGERATQEPLGRHSRQTRPLLPGQGVAAVALLLLTVAALVAGSAWVAGLAIAVALIAAVVGRRWPSFVSIATAAAAGAAVLVVAVRPWGRGGAAPQDLLPQALVIIAIALAAVAAPIDDAWSRLRPRRAGQSPDAAHDADDGTSPDADAAPTQVDRQPHPDGDNA